MNYIELDSIKDVGKKTLELLSGKYIAVSGGNTFKKIFPYWRHSKIKEMIFLPVDERIVAFDDEDSNWRMVFENLLMPNGLVTQKEHHVKDEDMMMVLLKKYLYPDYTFDQIFLGMGNDGHIASLFPSEHELFSKKIIEKTKKHNNYERITVTLKLIEKAKHVFLILLGEKKINMFDYVVTNAVTESPVFNVLKVSKRITVISSNET